MPGAHKLEAYKARIAQLVGLMTVDIQDPVKDLVKEQAKRPVVGTVGRRQL